MYTLGRYFESCEKIETRKDDESIENNMADVKTSENKEARLGGKRERGILGGKNVRARLGRRSESGSLGGKSGREK